MIHLNDFINVYVDTNILLALALVLWFAARFMLRLAGLKHAYSAQLRLLNGAFLVTLLAPIFVAIIGMFAGGSAGISINLSDYMLAQYLNGNFEMNPSGFESLLGFRHQLTSEVVNLETPRGVVLAAFIVTGIAVSLLGLMINIWRLRSLVRSAFVWRQFGNLRLCLSDTVTVPFSTRSIRHRIVVIPSNMLENTTDLRMVLGHEFQHLRQSDLQWEIALELLKPFFFWNPAFHIWKRQVETLRELACDQIVVQRKRFDVATYCECLLNVCKNSLQKRVLFTVGVPRVAFIGTGKTMFSANSAQDLRHRLVSLIDCDGKQCPKAIYALAIIPLLAVTMFASIAIQKPSDWSHDRLMLSSIVNLERLAQYNNTTE